MELKPQFMLLRNSPPPLKEVEKELPWHRMAMYMFARGCTMTEIANALGKNITTVSNALRQPWFQQKLMEIMAETGQKDILEIFRSEQFNSLATLIELRDNSDIAPKVRLDAAKDILDRALGKPTQRIEATIPQVHRDPAEEARMLEEENNRLLNQLL